MDDQAEHDQQPDRPTGGLVQAKIIAPTDMSEAPSYYANFVQVGMSPYEFTVHFSRMMLPLVSEPPAEMVTIDVNPQPIASISIPLNLVRAFMRALERQTESWERTFGQPLPTEPSSAQIEPQTEPPSTVQGVESQ